MDQNTVCDGLKIIANESAHDTNDIRLGKLYALNELFFRYIENDIPADLHDDMNAYFENISSVIATLSTRNQMIDILDSIGVKNTESKTQRDNLVAAIHDYAVAKGDHNLESLSYDMLNTIKAEP